MKIPPIINIEAEMHEFVRAFGGTVLSDELGPSPSFANADYVFLNDNIIAELKCSSEDKSDDSDTQKNIQRLWDKCVASGRIKSPGYGNFRIFSKDYPEEFQRDLYRVLARPIKRRIDKAGRQIKQTKRKLGMPSAHGLLLFANDGNFGLQPAQFAQAVKIALGSDFSSIDSLVLFTANMLAKMPGEDRHTLVWMVAERKGHPGPPEEFLNGLFVGWSRHLGSKFGTDIPLVGPIGPRNLDAMQFDKELWEQRQ